MLIEMFVFFNFVVNEKETRAFARTFSIYNGLIGPNGLQRCDKIARDVAFFNHRVNKFCLTIPGNLVLSSVWFRGLGYFISFLCGRVPWLKLVLFREFVTLIPYHISTGVVATYVEI